MESTLESHHSLPLVKESDVETSGEILERIHAQKNVQNTLATEAEEKGWIHRKLPFKTVTSEILDFPKMTQRDLKIFFIGLY